MANHGQSIGPALTDQRRSRTEIPAAAGAGATPDRLAQLAAPLLGRLDRTVVLIGLMGAGKSCVGRRLAARLGLDFIDSDAEFEASAGCTISEYFAHHGEAAFREGERRVIARLFERGPLILATGGGAFIDPDTRARILSRSTSVWIRADLPLLLKRTVGRDHRPLLKSGDPAEILGGLITARYPVYAQADITVDTTDETPEATVARVLIGLTDHLGLAPAAVREHS